MLTVAVILCGLWVAWECVALGVAVPYHLGDGWRPPLSVGEWLLWRRAR